MKITVIFMILFQTLSYAQTGNKETGIISGKLGYPSDRPVTDTPFLNF